MAGEDTAAEEAGEHHGAVGRKLFGEATLWQDWGEEASDSDPKYWELFTDLLMVAAATAMADAFTAQQNFHGLLEFVLLYSAIIHGWLLYTHHYTSRFLESSLLHSFILFFYLLGMAASIVNTSYETAQEFSTAVVLQRVAFLAMIAQVIWSIPRARQFAMVLGGVVTVTVALYLSTALYAHHNLHLVVLFWSLAAILDYCLEVSMMAFLSGRALVPVNIDHSKDRLGVLVLVMMGETVISATIAYREHVEEGLSEHENRQLYLVLIFSFLLVFMFTLLYFHVSPHPKDHAFRRSRLAGLSCLVLNKTLGLTLLMVGVCIKLAVRAVAEGEKMEPFGCYLLNVGVGGSMVLLFGMRCCHYWGKLPRPSHPPNVRFIMNAWWAVFGLGSVCPFFFPHWGGEPVPPLASAAVWLLLLCVVESSFTHVLGTHVIMEEEPAAAEAQEKQQPKEATPLLSQPQASYFKPIKEPDEAVTTENDVAASSEAVGATADKHVLLLISMQSIDRSVTRSQQEAIRLLEMNGIKYKVLDGADPDKRSKERREKLWDISGIRAKYPQFFVAVDGDENDESTTFWGDLERFQDVSEMKETANEFSFAIKS